MALDTAVGAPILVTEQNALSTTAEKIVSAANYTREVLVQNLDSTITVWVGGAETVTSSNGVRLRAGEAITFLTTGEIWAIAASGTPTVAIATEKNQ